MQREYHDLTLNKPRDKTSYLNIFFRADSSMHVYKREGYDFLTFLGDLGGLFDIMMVIGWSFTSLFTGRLLAAALISEVYRI